jgi:hypothetical protein
MNKYVDHLDKWESGFERRSIGRTKIAKGALLFFAGQAGAFSCTVRDVTNRGARVRLEGLSVLPLEFDLSFDNFRTIRKCKMVWREGDFVGVQFGN